MPDGFYSYTFGIENEVEATVTGSMLLNRDAVQLQSIFGEVIRLDGYSLSLDELTLYWQKITSVETDYAIFIHLRNSENKIIAQWDRQPNDEDYPDSMGLNEIIVDRIALDLPSKVRLNPEEYQFFVGLYEPSTFKRLPLDGDTTTEHAVVIPLKRVTK